MAAATTIITAAAIATAPSFATAAAGSECLHRPRKIVTCFTVKRLTGVVSFVCVSVRVCACVRARGRVL